MFNGSMSESNQDRVNLEGVQSAALTQLVEYIYTGEIEVSTNSYSMKILTRQFIKKMYCFIFLNFLKND